MFTRVKSLIDVRLLKDAEMYWQVLSNNSDLQVLKSLGLQRLIESHYTSFGDSAKMRQCLAKVLYSTRHTTSLNLYSITMDIFSRCDFT